VADYIDSVIQWQLQQASKNVEEVSQVFTDLQSYENVLLREIYGF
jgi:hypothetical protein